MTPGAGALRSMAVVIPARDEEILLAACLRSVEAAMDMVDLISVAVVVVLDRCVDGSAEVARAWADRIPLFVVEGEFAGVGAARDAGVAAARRQMAVAATEHVWIANTDADTVVPGQWLEQQRRLANSGLDLILGTVEPGPPEPGQERAHQLWFEEHDLVEGHSHVHGANLGIRLSELDRVGGFGGARVGEDVGVMQRVRDGHGRWLATDTMRVVTSSRRHGRASHGFAEYLRALDASVQSRT